MLYDEGSDDDDDGDDDGVGDYDDGDDEVDVYDNDEVNRSECAICDLFGKILSLCIPLFDGCLKKCKKNYGNFLINIDSMYVCMKTTQLPMATVSPRQ